MYTVYIFYDIMYDVHVVYMYVVEGIICVLHTLCTRYTCSTCVWCTIPHVPRYTAVDKK